MISSDAESIIEKKNNGTLNTGREKKSCIVNS